MANREELNAKATELGIENPESYGTKAELQAAIDDAPGQDSPGVNAPTEPTPEETPVENDGTATEPTEVSDEPQDVASERKRVLSQAHADAKENAAKEAEANQVDGE